MKEILVMHTDKSAKCLCIPAAVFIPEKEIFTQEINSTHSNHVFWFTAGEQDRKKKLRFCGDPFFEELFYKETGGKSRRHPKQAGPGIGPAQKLAKEAFYQVNRLQPVRNIRHPPPHMLLVDIVLVLQVADSFSQFPDSLYLAQFVLF